MKLNCELDKKCVYIVAVSFGPDSMCLLDLLRKEKCNLVAAHVNYHRRPESNSEQASLMEYCDKNKIRVEVLDTNNLKSSGNFQKWAREIRYEFFAKLEKDYKAKCVFVAHQQDDLIETYLMQKNKGNFVKYWGIAKKSTVKHAHIVRPLLDYSKAELRKYCDQNEVPYAIDSSNLEDHYLRNKIRHTVVEKLSIPEREKFIDEIKKRNEKRELKVINRLDVKTFLNLSYDDTVLLISNYLNANGQHVDLSRDFIENIKQSFKSQKSNICIHLVGGYSISKEYYDVFFVNENQKISYNYEITTTTKINDMLFEIDLTKNYQERNIETNMFPLTIKPVSSEEEYKISNYVCKVRRLFIDWKVPPHLRSCWPGIYDKNGELVYIPRYKRDFIDNHKSKFIIKFAK